MRIILHCNEYSPDTLPGAKRIRVFYNYLKAQGHDVKVLTSKANLYRREDQAIESPDIIYCPALPLKKKNVVYRFLSPWTFNRTALWATHKLKKADVVFTTSPPIMVSRTGYRIAGRLKAKLVYDVRDIWPDVAIEMGSFSKKSIYYMVFWMLSQWMYRHADLITAVSPGKVEKLKGYLPINQRDKVCLLENGLDEAFLENEIDHSVVGKYNLDKYFTVLYTGNVGLAQGLRSLLDLAKQVDSRKIQFLIFGKGAERKILRNYAKENHIVNVHFENVVSERTVFSLLHYAKLAYIPLVNANLKDSIPTKTYEALGVGCPVLMSAVGDATKLVDECKLGIHISPSEMDRLPEAFSYIYNNYEEIMKNKEYSKRIILEKHSRQKGAENLEKMLKKLVGEA